MIGCAKSTKTDTESSVPEIRDTAAFERQREQKFSNERFRNVSVTKLNDTLYRIRGEAQIFEATLSWVIEDGHNELSKGFEMTDAGAPEWGKFDFTASAGKREDNSTLTLILFEVSAKDGSRQHELAIGL